MLERMGTHIEVLYQCVAAVDRQLVALHNTNPPSLVLTEIPSVGPLRAVTRLTKLVHGPCKSRGTLHGVRTVRQPPLS